MPRRYFIIIIFCLFGEPVVSYSQLGFELAGGARSLSLGRASVTLPGANSVLGNQAAMVYTEKLDIVANAARRYNISGLDMFSLGLVYNSKLGVIGTSIVQYGYDDYKEQKIGLAVARKLDSGLSIGIQMDLLNLSLPEFGNHTFFTAEIGLYSVISSKIHLGFHLFSPGNISVDNEYDLPTRLRLGPKFIISEDLTIYTEAEKVIDLPLAFKGGISYRLNDNIDIYMGIIPTHSEYSFGFSYSFEQAFEIDGGFMYDQKLGTTPSVGLSYSKK